MGAEPLGWWCWVIYKRKQTSQVLESKPVSSTPLWPPASKPSSVVSVPAMMFVSDKLRSRHICEINPVLPKLLLIITTIDTLRYFLKQFYVSSPDVLV